MAALLALDDEEKEDIVDTTTRKRKRQRQRQQQQEINDDTTTSTVKKNRRIGRATARYYAGITNTTITPADKITTTATRYPEQHADAIPSLIPNKYGATTNDVISSTDKTITTANDRDISFNYSFPSSPPLEMKEHQHHSNSNVEMLKEPSVQQGQRQEGDHDGCSSYEVWGITMQKEEHECQQQQQALVGLPDELDTFSSYSGSCCWDKNNNGRHNHHHNEGGDEVPSSLILDPNSSTTGDTTGLHNDNCPSCYSSRSAIQKKGFFVPIHEDSDDIKRMAKCGKNMQCDEKLTTLAFGSSSAAYLENVPHHDDDMNQQNNSWAVHQFHAGDAKPRYFFSKSVMESRTRPKHYFGSAAEVEWPCVHNFQGKKLEHYTTSTDRKVSSAAVSSHTNDSDRNNNIDLASTCYQTIRKEANHNVEYTSTMWKDYITTTGAEQEKTRYPAVYNRCQVDFLPSTQLLPSGAGNKNKYQDMNPQNSYLPSYPRRHDDIKLSHLSQQPICLTAGGAGFQFDVNDAGRRGQSGLHHLNDVQEFDDSYAGWQFLTFPSTTHENPLMKSERYSERGQKPYTSSPAIVHPPCHDYDKEDRGEPTSPRCLRRLPPHYTERNILPLSTKGDKQKLSKFHSLVRSQFIEVFSASSADVASRMNSKRVTLNQVGIRCRFCAHLPYRERSLRSSSFPSSMSKLYQCATMMVRDHFGNCKAMHPSVMNRYLTLKAESSHSAPDSKTYWMKSARDELGLIDTDDGIRFSTETKELHKKLGS